MPMAAEIGAVLDKKMLALVDELLRGKGTKEACNAAGVTRAIADRWMAQTPFRDEMARRRRSTLEVYINRALILATLAQSTLTEIMTDDNADPEIKVRAAIAALASADRLAQHPSVNPDEAGIYRPMFMLPPGAKVAVLVDGTQKQADLPPLPSTPVEAIALPDFDDMDPPAVE